jgi:hypothetical protein
VGPKVAEWVESVIDRRSEKGDTIYELVDVAEFKLPVFDEPVLPAMVHAIGMLPASLFWPLRYFYTPRVKKSDRVEVEYRIDYDLGTDKRNQEATQRSTRRNGLSIWLSSLPTSS